MKIRKLLLMSVVLNLNAVYAQVSSSTPKATSEYRDCLQDNKCQEQLKSAYYLARRHDFTFLLHLYEHAEPNQRAWIIQGIYGSRTGRTDPTIIEFMKNIAFSSALSTGVSDTEWYALQFLADRGDKQALSILAQHGGDGTKPYQFQVSCGEWAESLKAFGAFRFRQSSKVLISSLNSSCIDVSGAAEESLRQIYPGRCSSQKTVEGAISCYEAQWGGEAKKP